MKLYYDKWEKNLDFGSELEINIQEKAIFLSYFKQLNQKEYSVLTLKGNVNSLTIGGGNGVYICYFTIGDNEAFFNLISVMHSDLTDEIEVVCGGQAGLFEPKFVVSYEVVVEAIMYFIENETMNPKLIWKKT